MNYHGYPFSLRSNRRSPHFAHPDYHPRQQTEKTAGIRSQKHAEIRELLSEHEGPVILSGDFNTWRQKRKDLVAQLALDLELNEITFERDHRVKFFGQVLDHMYVRGLHQVDSSTELVDTSDHNPMSAVFSLFAP